MNILKIDHIGIAVKSIEESLKFYRLLGLEAKGTEEVKDQQVRVAFLPLGDSELELLESTSSDGPIARYLEKMVRESNISPFGWQISKPP